MCVIVGSVRYTLVSVYNNILLLSCSGVLEQDHKNRLKHYYKTQHKQKDTEISKSKFILCIY